MRTYIKANPEVSLNNFQLYPDVWRVLELAAAHYCTYYDSDRDDYCNADDCLSCRANELLPPLKCACGEYTLIRQFGSTYYVNPVTHAPDKCGTPTPKPVCDKCGHTI